jgi:hypothetical protein
MNKFYNVLVVLCLVFSGLSASERQEKLSFMQLTKQKINNTAGYYVKGWALLHALGTANAFITVAKGIDYESNALDRRFHGSYGKNVFEQAVKSNARILYFSPVTATLFFGVAIGVHTIKELPCALNIPYKTSESAEI